MAEKECLGRKTVKMEGTSECLSGASVAPPNQRKIVKEKRTKNQSKKQIRKEKTNKITKQNKNTTKATYCIWMNRSIMAQPELFKSEGKWGKQ